MKLSLPQFQPPFNMLIYFFCKFFFESHQCMTKLNVRVLCFPYFMDNLITYDFFYFKERGKNQ
jgi:hypothetical protein